MGRHYINVQVACQGSPVITFIGYLPRCHLPPTKHGTYLLTDSFHTFVSTPACLKYQQQQK